MLSWKSSGEYYVISFGSIIFATKKNQQKLKDNFRGQTRNVNMKEGTYRCWWDGNFVIEIPNGGSFKKQKRKTKLARDIDWLNFVVSFNWLWILVEGDRKSGRCWPNSQRFHWGERNVLVVTCELVDLLINTVEKFVTWLHGGKIHMYDSCHLMDIWNEEFSENPCLLFHYYFLFLSNAEMLFVKQIYVHM